MQFHIRIDGDLPATPEVQALLTSPSKPHALATALSTHMTDGVATVVSDKGAETHYSEGERIGK